MWRCVLLATALSVLTLAALAQSADLLRMSGCISRDAKGKLIFGSERTEKVYVLQGDLNLLQQHVNTLVSIAGHLAPSGMGSNSPVLNVESLRVISQSCTSVLPSGERVAVEGKLGQVEKGVPIATTSSVAETTPGFQTESSVQQFTRREAAQPAASTPAPLPPSLPDQAGQSQAAADTNAEAASRAEPYPGTTLGVEIQTAPPSSVEAQQTLSPR